MLVFLYSTGALLYRKVDKLWKEVISVEREYRELGLLGPAKLNSSDLILVYIM